MAMDAEPVCALWTSRPTRKFQSGYPWGRRVALGSLPAATEPATDAL